MRHPFVILLALALGASPAAGLAKELTEAQLLEAATATGDDAPGPGKLGTFKGTAVVVEAVGEIRILRYDVAVSDCDEVGGVVRNVAMPTGATGTLRRFCVPAILMGEQPDQPGNDDQ